MKLTIDYCSECDHLDKAVETAETILQKFSDRFNKVELVPTEGGVFRVSIDGEIIYDLQETGYSTKKIAERVKKYNEK